MSCLTVETAAIEVELAKNWGWLLVAGVLNFISGFLALCSPTAASDMIVAIIAGTMIVVGFINMFGACYVESSYRYAILFSGFIVLLLGILMATHVVTSLVILTSIITALYLCEGIFRTFLACSYRDIPGRMYFMISGILTLVLSVLIISTLPASSTYTLGVLLGTNWVLYGLNRIALAMVGRVVANNLVDTNASGGSRVKPTSSDNEPIKSSMV